VDVFFLIFEWVLDCLIVGGFTFVCAMPFVALLALLREGLTRTARANDRKRRYHDLLKRQRGTSSGEQKNWTILRNSARKRVFLPARLVLNTLGSTLDATIVDISETGARLAFGRIIHLPKGAELDLELRKTGERVRARVVWATETQCGVGFIGTPQAIAPLLSSAATMVRDAA
jgi:hypothetical protein